MAKQRRTIEELVAELRLFNHHEAAARLQELHSAAVKLIERQGNELALLGMAGTSLKVAAGTHRLEGWKP